MVAIPNWLIGKHATTVTITGQDVSASTGVLTDNASGAKSLVGYLDEVSISLSNTLEDIQAMDVRRENSVITGSRTSVSLVEILKIADSSGTPSNILANAGLLFDYAKFVLTRGGRTWTFYGVVQSYNESIHRGKSVGTLELAMIDPGAANPTYV